MRVYDSLIDAIPDIQDIFQFCQVDTERFWSWSDKRHHLYCGLLLDDDCFAAVSLFCHMAASSMHD